MQRLSPSLAAIAVLSMFMVPPLHEADAAGPYDGSYHGTIKLTRSLGHAQRGAGACTGNAEGTPWNRTITNGVIKMQWVSSPYELKVGFDGTIRGSANVGISQINASGKITGNRLVMEYGSQFCTYLVEAQK